MRKFSSALVVLAVTGGSYALGSGAGGHTGHTVNPTVTSQSILEGTGPGTTQVNVSISVSPAPQANEVIKVNVGCQEGTASAGSDYACAQPPNNEVTFNGNALPPDATTKSITAATLVRDDVSEANETFTVVVFNARCEGSASCSVNEPADVSVTISNDDQARGTISVNDASSPEGDTSEKKDITFAVTLSRPCTSAFTIAYGTESGTATEGTDFETADGSTLVFDPGAATKTFVVRTIGDNAGEPNETFTVVLTPQAGACLASYDVTEPPSDVHGTGTVTDDDGPPGTAVATTCSGNASGDFNGDGRRDLAVGIPGQAVNALGNAGAVQVIYGALGTGLQDPGKQIFVEGVNGVDGQAEAGDQYGACLAAGRFNDDSFDDLAIGVPGEDVTSARGSFVDAGAVNVIYGTSTGLDAGGSPADQLWVQDSAGVLGGSESQDGFGGALATGDFNGDGRDDLAIGVPFEDVGSVNSAGAVNVLPGLASGLSATGDRILHQNAKRFAGSSERDDVFGAALAAGDLDGDGRDDLVVGVPGEALGATARAGVIQVVRAGAKGLTGLLDRLWFQGNSGILDTAESSDRFGAAVAVGDFNGDGTDDVAVGIPFEDLGTRTDVGAVAVLYGSSTGPVSTNNELWSAADSTKTTGDVPNAGDQFGAALTVGDFNGNAFDDLAIGVPLNDFAGTNAGSVNVVYGATTGLGTPEHFTQSNVTAPGNEGAEPEDAFGSALTSGDYNGDARDELAVGVPKEDAAGAPDAGAVDVVAGSATTLQPASGQHWTQDTGTVQLGGSQAGDQYGASVG